MNHVYSLAGVCLYCGLDAQSAGSSCSNRTLFAIKPRVKMTADERARVIEAAKRVFIEMTLFDEKAFDIEAEADDCVTRSEEGYWVRARIYVRQGDVIP